LALGIGLAFVMALTIASHSTDAPKVMVGTKDEIYYYRSATKEDAIALGQALKETGFLTNSGAGILLSKGKSRGATVVSFILKDGAWNHPDAISNFGEIGRRIAPSVGGFPLRMRLIDQRFVVQKDLAVGKETIGMRDTIYYFGSATSQDAIALGQSLRSAGAMKDVGATILLAKGGVTTISFVVKQTPWERPEVVAVFESLMRQVAPSVGGLPLKLRLLDPGGVVHKEVSIL
jgi:hypothetical protein